MENNKNIYAKLLEVQKKVGAIKKDQTNPFFKSKYADINDIIEVVKPVMNEVGLVVMQNLVHIDSKPALLTVIADPDSAEKIDSVCPLIENPDPQKMGAIITYYRRYALQSILFLQAEDSDANDTKPQNAFKSPQSYVNLRDVDDEGEPSYEPAQGQKVDYAKKFEKIPGNRCSDCNIGIYIIGKTSGKPYCSEKCWLKPKVVKQEVKEAAPLEIPF